RNLPRKDVFHARGIEEPTEAVRENRSRKAVDFRIKASSDFVDEMGRNVAKKRTSVDESRRFEERTMDSAPERSVPAQAFFREEVSSFALKPLPFQIKSGRQLVLHLFRWNFGDRPSHDVLENPRAHRAERS